MDSSNKVAIVCIAKKEDNYIREWIDYHTKLGFDHFFIYENNWRSNLDLPNVTCIPWDGNEKQLPAYNDAIKKLTGEYKWAAFIDVDEFFALKRHDNIKDLLYSYHDFIANGLGVNWAMFGSNGHIKIENGNYQVVDRFTKRQSGVHDHVKSILLLDHNVKVFIDPHRPTGGLTDTNMNTFNSPFNPKGTHDVIQLNHYFCKTIEEYKHKRNRGRADCSFMHTFDLFHSTDAYSNEIEDLTAIKFKYL